MLAKYIGALQAEADPNAVDSEMSKPIHAAAFSGHAAIVEILFPVTSPREGEKWSIDALMAETSSAGSAASPQQASKALLSPFCADPRSCYDLRVEALRNMSPTSRHHIAPFER